MIGFVSYRNEGMVQMIVIGADTHKVTHTVAAVQEATGRVGGDLTVRAKRRSFEDLLVGARGLDDPDRVWAIEDCRHVSGALERFLISRGERIARIPPKMMAGARKGSRERGKSDSIDAVAIARAAIKEGIETLPIAQLAGRELDVRLLVDHRERLVAQRTALINDLRWNLHDLWPEFEVPPRALVSGIWQDRIDGRLRRAAQQPRVRIARDELRRIRELTRTVNALQAELADLVAELAPALLAEQGCGPLTDAKLARSAGAAPLPASSGNTQRHRLDRGGNRQINCALHRLAISKARLDPGTRDYLTRKQAEGKTRREAIRCLKRHLARRIWRILKAASPTTLNPPATPLSSRPPIIAKPGHMIHCNTPTATPNLT